MASWTVADAGQFNGFGFMGVDERDNQGEPEGVASSGSGDQEVQPLAQVRYGLGKELRLYPDVFVARQNEVDDELRLNLDHIRRLVLMPGEHTPSKLVLMFELDDGNTIIVAEGMTNVKDFRKLLGVLAETRPEIELDPPNMDEQLMQALDIRRRSLLGCYGLAFGLCVILWVVYIVVALIGHGHVTP